VWQKASELTDEERASLAGLLIESLEGEPDTDVEQAWSEEIRKRLADIDAGVAKTIPWEEARQRLVDRLNAR
jgi:putative addiction module component (TIGR02574 family)